MIDIFMSSGDSNVRRIAIDLQDSALLTRMEGGDLTALEVKYHLSCLTALRNESETSSIDRKEGKIEARAFVELITHVENSIENGIFCFKFLCYAKSMRVAYMTLALL